MKSKQLTKHQQYWLSLIKACPQQRISMMGYAQQRGIEVYVHYDAKSRLVRDGVLPRKTKMQMSKGRDQSSNAHSLHHPSSQWNPAEVANR